MPATDHELCALGLLIASHELAPDFVGAHRWADGDVITDAELTNAILLGWYELRRKNNRQKPAQRRALKLLRSLLAPTQRRHFSIHREVRVRGTLGGVYRLHPATGGVWRIEKHGKHWFGVVSFCIHDCGDCPRADHSVAHLLMLRSDEQHFLDIANKTERYPSCWNGDYMRRMRGFRLASQEAIIGDRLETSADL